uniref:Uncharacterized protein n=1 Tax=Anguilla anguilla TaxID=7936 RepID=A0A0E9SGK4_ANGAN
MSVSAILLHTTGPELRLPVLWRILQQPKKLISSN